MPHIIDNYLEKYDFFLKADPDTYINTAQLQRTLSQVTGCLDTVCWTLEWRLEREC